MKIKVAMIAELPLPGEPIDGGVQAVTSYLVSCLRNCPDVELHVITFRMDGGPTRSLNRENYVQYTIPFSSFGTITGFRRDQENLDRCLASIQPDLVHSQGAGHHGILASRSGFPSVTTIHGIQSAEATFQSTASKKLRTRLQGWLATRYCIQRATYTILISPYVSQHYGEALSGEHYLIPNPVDTRFFDVVRRPEARRVLFLGRLYALKGVRELIQAISQLPYSQDVEIVLAGSLADKAYVDQIRHLTSKFGMASRTQLPGILPTDRILSELARCTCLVLPSFQETAPMVIQEAMAAGVPVIASDICGIPYQVADTKTGFLVPPGDIPALTDRLSKIFSDADLSRKLGIAARKKANSEYRAEHVAKQTVNVYKQILDHSGSRHSCSPPTL